MGELCLSFKVCSRFVYKIPYRRARVQPLGRVRRASKGILHTRVSCIQVPVNLELSGDFLKAETIYN